MSDTTMRAMVLRGFGGPEVLEAATIDRPPADQGQVVVRVAYAGVNPADWKTREGWLARYFDYPFPFVVGFDAAASWPRSVKACPGSPSATASSPRRTRASASAGLTPNMCARRVSGW